MFQIKRVPPDAIDLPFTWRCVAIDDVRGKPLVRQVRFEAPLSSIDMFTEDAPLLETIRVGEHYRFGLWPAYAPIEPAAV
jgi:hypothetical protein